MDIRSKRVQRGAVRLVVALAAASAWFNKDLDQAMGAFVVGEGLKAWLGLTDGDSQPKVKVNFKQNACDDDDYLGH